MSETPERIWVNSTDADVGEVVWNNEEGIEAIRDLTKAFEYVRADLYDEAIAKNAELQRKAATLERWLNPIVPKQSRNKQD